MYNSALRPEGASHLCENSSTAGLNAVKRHALIERILETERSRLTLIAAPGGYGKTVLMRQLLNDLTGRGGHTCVHLPLSKAQRVPGHFAKAFAKAVARAGVKTDDITENLNTSDGEGAAAAVSEIFFRLGDLDAPPVVFIDNYEQAESREVNDIFGGMLKDDMVDIRFIVSTRHSTVPGLTKLRLSGDCTEISAGDLQFSDEDVAAFFGLSSADTAAFEIRSQTEGWPLAIGLAKLWRNDGQDLDVIVHRLRGDEKYIAQYFADEFLDVLPDDIRDFIVDMSVVDAFDADLADAVRHETGSAKYVSYLRSANAFIAPDRKDPGRLRYHRLLREFLTQRLEKLREPAAITEMHKRAAAYYKLKGDEGAELKHATRADNLRELKQRFDDDEADVFWLMADLVDFRNAMTRFDKIKGPGDMRLCLATAFFRMRNGELRLARDLLETAWKEIEAPSGAVNNLDKFESELILLQATYNLYTDHEERMITAEKMNALAKAGAFKSAMGQGLLFNVHGSLDARAGDIARAKECFEFARSNFIDAESHYCTIYAETHLATLEMLDAKPAKAERWIEQAERACVKFLPADRLMKATTELSNARVLYETGRVKEAWRIIEAESKSFLNSGQYWWEMLAHYFYCAAMCALAVKNDREPFYIVSKGLAIARTREIKRLEQALYGLKLHLASIVGDREEADGALKAIMATPQADSYHWGEQNNWLARFFVIMGRLRYRIAFGQDMKNGAFADAPYEETLYLIEQIRSGMPQEGHKWARLKLSVYEALAAHKENADTSRKMSGYLAEALPDGDAMFAPLLQEGKLAVEALTRSAASLRRTKSSSPLAGLYIKHFYFVEDYISSVDGTEIKLSDEQMKYLRLLDEGETREGIAETLGQPRSKVDSQLRILFNTMECGENGRLRAIAMYRRHLRDKQKQLNGAASPETTAPPSAEALEAQGEVRSV